MKWQGKRVLVTGGTGFVGSHLVNRLVNEGAEVVSTYQTIDANSYFAHQKLADHITLAQVDVTDFDGLFHLITKHNTEYIFHLAAQAIVEVAYYNPRQTLNTNVMGTVNVLEAARLFPTIKAVIVASSDKAYGKLDQKKYKETSPLQGDHPYDVSKSATDLITLTYAKTYQVPAVVTRFGNIYGLGDPNFSRIIPGIMDSIVKGTKLELRSNGKAVRDYLNVDDVAEGYLLLANKIDQVKGEAFNFGSDDNYSVVNLIKTAEKILDRKVTYTIQDTAKNEIPYQSLDYAKASKKLGWKPRQTLAKTLPDILEYYYERHYTR